MVGNCALCGKSRPLIKESHIIPDFMYNGLRNDKGRMLFNKPQGHDQDFRRKIIQQSFFDKYILCFECDNERLSNLERYAAGVLYGGLNPEKDPIQFSNPISYTDFVSIFVRGFNYSKLKLFFLSILLRAHISTNPFFKTVNLDSCVELELKDMIMNNDPGPDNKYPLTIYGLRWDATRLLRVIAEPYVIKTKELEAVSFLINGFLYHFEIHSSEENRPSQLYLSPDRDLEIRVLQPALAQRLFASYLRG